MNPLRLMATGFFVTLASLLVAQTFPDDLSGSDRGFTFTTIASGNHDSASGWSSVLDSSLRYDCNRIFGMEVRMLTSNLALVIAAPW